MRADLDCRMTAAIISRGGSMEVSRIPIQVKFLDFMRQ